jgi:glutamate-1-semialdehyde aminotransferase
MAWAWALQHKGCFLQAGFTSLAHTDEDIKRTIEAAREVFAEI